MLPRCSGQSALETGGHIALRAGSGDGESEDLTREGEQATGRLMAAGTLHLA
jgi:hypothetical protein